MSYPIGEANRLAKHRTTTLAQDQDLAPTPPPAATFRPPMPGPSPSPSPIAAEDAEDLDATTAASAGSFTQASTDDGPPQSASLAKMQQRGLGKAAEMAFRGVGEALNEVMAEPRTIEQEPDTIWLATDAEAKGVGEPVGRIIARRIPDLPGDQATDAADLIAAAIPLGVWVVRGLAETVPRVRRARRLTRLQEAQQAQPQGATYG